MKPDLHPVDLLFEALQHFQTYPIGVVPVPARIQGVAFFPGGAGLWGARPGAVLPPWPVGGVMILGHNFDKLAGFTRSLASNGENMNGETWRNLLPLLETANVPPKRCFFTNAYMGLIDGPSAVGRFPGSRDKDFVRCCQDFLVKQISVQQPRVILTLGKKVLPMVAAISPEVRVAWAKVRRLKDADQNNTALVYPSHFQNVAHPVAVAALAHPAFRHIHISKRNYGNQSGNEAEVALIRDAIQLAGGIVEH